MQFDEVLVREDVFASDTLAVVDTMAPDPCELEVAGQFAVHLERQVLDRPVSRNREWCFEVGRFSGSLGVDADDIEGLVDDTAKLFAGGLLVEFHVDTLATGTGQLLEQLDSQPGIGIGCPGDDQQRLDVHDTEVVFFEPGMIRESGFSLSELLNYGGGLIGCVVVAAVKEQQCQVGGSDEAFAAARPVLEAEAECFRAEVLADISGHPDLRTALMSFGRKFLSFLGEQDSVEFTCLIHEVARDYPQIGRTFYTAAFEAVCAAVCGLLVQGQENGDLRDDFDPRDVAEDLISLLKGFGMVRAQLGLTTLPYKDIDQHVTRAVDTILVAYRASGGVGSA